MTMWRIVTRAWHFDVTLGCGRGRFPPHAAALFLKQEDAPEKCEYAVYDKTAMNVLYSNWIKFGFLSFVVALAAVLYNLEHSDTDEVFPR